MNLYKSINFATDYKSPNLFARKVWQAICDWYAEHKGDVSHIDNLLCDYDYLCKQFYKYQNFEFWWTHFGFGTSIYNYEDEDWELFVKYEVDTYNVEIYEK